VNEVAPRRPGADAAAQPEIPENRPARESRWATFRDGATLYGAVGVGSVIGGVLRYLAAVLIHVQLGFGAHWGTLFVNVTGSFVIGFYAALTGPDGRLLTGPRRRHFVMAGLCGGYTTFSIFSLETLRLAQSGALAAAGLNIGLSVVTWLLAVWLGHALATRLNRLRGS
jgi:CrcB protein